VLDVVGVVLVVLGLVLLEALGPGGMGRGNVLNLTESTASKT
jgi:hypothetical protein